MKTPASYRHTQPGRVMWVALGAATALAAGVFVATLSLEGPGTAVGRWGAGAGVVILALALAGFYAMTIEIADGRLTWSMGSGWLRKSVQVSEIREATSVRNRWWHGWGIHGTGHGWLYNVDGMQAVEIETHGGRRFRLGTDEPRTLVRAIQRARSEERT